MLHHEENSRKKLGLYICPSSCGFQTINQDILAVHKDFCVWLDRNPPSIDHLNQWKYKHFGNVIPRSPAIPIPGIPKRRPLPSPRRRIGINRRITTFPKPFPVLQPNNVKNDEKDLIAEVNTANRLTSIIFLLVHFVSRNPFFIIGVLILFSCQAVSSASLDATNKNFVYEHKSSALVNSEQILIMSQYSPCDMNDYSQDVDTAVEEQEALCSREFQHPITLFHGVIKSTITKEFVTLDGVHSYLNGKYGCERIGSTLVTVKTHLY